MAQNLSHVKLNLKIACWNICGLYEREGNKSISKFSYHDFKTEISDFDIFCLQEIKVGPNENMKLDKYFEKIITRKRHRNAKSDSGGLAVYVKESLKEGITFVPNKTTEYLWVKLRKEFFNSLEDTYICFAYINPIGSTYRSDLDILDMIKQDLAVFSNTGRCILMGDMNGHTNTEPDFVKLDDSHINTFPSTPESDILLPRRNQDSRIPDDRGKEILQLCKSSMLNIVNGRKLGDITGKFTCYNARAHIPSLIDYVMADTPSFNDISYFKVNKLTLFSDHCLIHFRLNVLYNLQPEDKPKSVDLKPTIPRFIWSTEADTKFKEALGSDNIVKNLSMLQSNHHSIDENCIDQMVHQLNSSLILAAEIAMVPKKSYNKNLKRNKRKKRKTRYFDKTCLSIKQRIAYLNRKLNNNPWDRSIRTEYYHQKKCLKQTIKKNIVNIRENILSKLRELNETDPKAYWTLINELEEIHTEKSQPDDNIPAHKWMNHFRNLVQSESSKTGEQIKIAESIKFHENLNKFSQLDYKITSEETTNCIKLLKKGKAPGGDQIINEMLKAGREVLAPILANLFNYILVSGYFPEAWAESYIKPLFKGGSVYDPNDYRGISLSSCVGKLFCSVLNNRLVSYLVDNDIYKPHQIAFRKNCRTADHIFVLRTLIDKYVKRKVKDSAHLYVCFVDLKKAFDTVWREGLLYKLLQLRVGGNFYTIIFDMYTKCKVSIKLTEGITESFISNIGVKQGCILSPTLFNVFLNDIPDIFHSDETSPVELNNKKLNCLMYADDIALVSTSKEGLQYCMNKLYDYCKQWNLTINCKKTKVIIFNVGGKLMNKHMFTMGSNPIEVVKQMKYLGILFDNNCSFTSAIDNLKDKGNKALFKLFKSFGNYTPDIKTSLHLFDSMIKPILLYGSEVWGAYCYKFDTLIDMNTQNNSAWKTRIYQQTAFEKMHLRWCKYILGVHSKSSNLAVTSDLGRYPLFTDIFTGMVKFWLRLQNYDKNSLLYDSYVSNISLMTSGDQCWLSNIRKIIDKVDLSNCFDINGNIKHNSVINSCKSFVKHTYEKQFHSDLFNDKRTQNEGNKLRTFRGFKKDISLESYLLNIKSRKMRQNFTKLRISSHNLAIETGRHRRYNKTNIPVNMRLCDFCIDKIEDEMHIILYCNRLETDRQEMLDAFSRDIKFRSLNDSGKFNYIMKCDTDEKIKNMSRYLKKFVVVKGKM